MGAGGERSAPYVVGGDVARGAGAPEVGVSVGILGRIARTLRLRPEVTSESASPT